MPANGNDLTVFTWLCDSLLPSVSVKSQERYVEDLCRTGMPNTETTLGKDSAPDGYAEMGMPNTYAKHVFSNKYIEDPCRKGMPNNAWIATNIKNPAAMS